MKITAPLLTFALLSAAARADMTLTSPDIRAGAALDRAQVYAGCGGGNRSPALRWSGAPAATRSFAVTVFDPDAPTGHGWWHWLVVDIPGAVHALPAAAGTAAATALPAAARQFPNDFGSADYGGACPPQGDKAHRYRFTVYALDVGHLELPAHATPARVDAAIRKHALDSARIEALYRR